MFKKKEKKWSPDSIINPTKGPGGQDQRPPKEDIPTTSKPTSESEIGSDLNFKRKATKEEAKKYDYAAARGKRTTMGVLESIGLVVRSSLGGGISVIHVTVMYCGVWTAMALNVFVGILVADGMYSLVRTAQRMYGRIQKPSLTYADLTEASLCLSHFPTLKECAKGTRHLVDALLVMTHFGSCLVYQMLISRIIKQQVDETPDVDNSIEPGLRTYILALIVPIMLLSLITSLAYLSPFAMVADLFICMTAAAAVYYGTQDDQSSTTDMTAFKSFNGMVLFLGNCLFSVEGIGTTLAIENNMTKPKKIGIVIAIGNVIVVALNGIVGFFGYYRYGDGCSGPITVNFPWTPFPIMLKTFMGLALFVTYSLNYWFPFVILWDYIKPWHNPKRFWLWEHVYRTLFVVGITGVALLIPNIYDNIGIIAFSSITLLGIVIPAFLELIVVWEDPGLGKYKWRLVKAVSTIVCGMVMCLVGTFHSVWGLLEFMHEEFFE